MKTIKLSRGWGEIKTLMTFFGDLWDEFAICGGFPRWCLSPCDEPKPYGDVDIYCPSMEVFDKVKVFLADNHFKVKHENAAALTYEIQTLVCTHIGAGENTSSFENFTLQLIKPVNQGKTVLAGDRETILSHFDFTVVRASILNDQEGVVDDDFEHDEEHSLLRLKTIHCPISSTIRCMKYGHKGYFIQPSEVVKLFADWDSRDDQYKLDILNWLHTLQESGEMSQEEIDHLESLLRID